MAGDSRMNFGDIHTTHRGVAYSGDFRNATFIVPDRKQQDTDAFRKCRNALYLTDPEIDRAGLISAKGKRVDGTCEWIREGATYKSWRRGNTQLLWISGGPGKGKTILSIFLTQELEQEEQTIYYFCASNDPKRNNAAAVLRGLLWHVTKKSVQLSEHLLQHLDDPKKIQHTLESPEALWSILVKAFEDTRIRKTFCVLDGLDELDEDSQAWLVTKLVSGTPTTASENLKVVVVSRPILGLERSARVNLDPDNDESVGQDIQMFITARVEELAERHRFTKTFRQKVEDSLLQRAEGTFLWVGFAMVELLRNRTSTEILAALCALPKGLPGIYSRMLLQIEPDFRPTGLLILRWVTMALHPLSLAELAGATNTPSGDIGAEQAIRDWITMCGPIVVIQDEKVNLVHQSARDYLLQKEVNRDPTVREFQIVPEEAHLALASTCLDCIQQSSENIDDWPLPEPSFSRTLPWHNPLLRYAIKNWPEHIRGASTLADDLVQTNHIFREPQLQRRWWKAYIGQDWPLDECDLSTLHIACCLGISRWVQLLLATGEVDVDSKDDDGQTPLSRAAENGYEGVVRVLLATGKVRADSKDDYGQTPLSLAAEDGHEGVVQALLATGKVDVNSKDEDGWTPLSWAAENGHEGVLRMLRQYV